MLVEGPEGSKRPKQLILSRVKQMQPSSQNNQPSLKMQSRGSMRIDTEQDFRNMPFEGKAKYDNELKANTFKSENVESAQKTKKFFYEHYDTNTPYYPNIGSNNNNPSGRPPNIPAELYKQVQVKPKRPWVYLGNENLPPVHFEQLNESQFKTANNKNAQKRAHKKQENQNQGRKKPAMKANNDESDDSLNVSDEMSLDEGESIFTSRFDAQSKTSKSKVSKQSRSKNLQYDDDDDGISDGTETKKRNQSLFDDEDNDDDLDNSELEEKQQSSRKPSKKEVIKNKRMQHQSD